MFTRKNLTLAVAAFAALTIMTGGGPLAQTRITASTTDVAPYFPLRVGNQWVYQRNSATQRDQWRAEVTGRVIAANGRAYFSLAGYFGPSRLVRASARNVVSEFNPNRTSDNLWYLLGGSVGTTWEIQLVPLPTATLIPDCISGSKATIASRSEVVKVPAGEFRDVVRVDYRSPCADAGLNSEWFAPGVGLVRREENSFAGPIVSELVSSEIGDLSLPRLPYSTALLLDRPLYYNNLMPSTIPNPIPTVTGFFVLRNRTSTPVELLFGGCKSVSLKVVDETGQVLVTASGNDGGCCLCLNIQRFILVNDTLTLPFSFKLATADGKPLADGHYGVVATLDTLETNLDPSATARIEVQSAY
jgi:hypothetical protein